MEVHIIEVPLVGGGGEFHDRMIQLVKRILRKVWGNARLTYDELYTILVEVECTVNCRPLTYVSTDELEVEPLTLSQLLCGHRIQSLPEVILDNDSSFNEKEILTQRMKYINCLLTHFWKRFTREYLVSLREHHDLTLKGGIQENIKEGAVVYVHEEHQPRGHWKMGKVEPVMKGRDGKIRGATAKVITRGKPTYLNRPLTRLYPLEVSEVKPFASNKTDNFQEVDIARERPIRRAALQADFSLEDDV